METLKAFIRGEPLVLRGVVVAVLTAVGVHVADGTVDSWLAVVTPLVLVLLTRHTVTPAVNPQVPTTIAVKQTNGEEPADLPPVQLPPVRTFTGDQR